MSPILIAEKKESTADHVKGTRGQQAAVFYPEECATERSIIAAIFVLSFLYLCLFRTTSALDRDEGIILQGANRILRGQVLYRDFFGFYTPGSYYFVALLFRLFGNSLEVARTALVLFGAVCSAVTYVLARRVAERNAALLVTGLVLVTTLPFRFMYLHNWDSTAWACLTVYCWVRLLERRHWAWAFATGSFLALTGAFEQSKGAGLALGVGASWLAITFFQRRSCLTGKEILGVVVGLAWPVVLIISYFAQQHSLLALWEGLLWPLHHYSAANKVLYGDPSWPHSVWHDLFRRGPWVARVFNALVVSPSFFITGLPIIAVAVFAALILLRSRLQISDDRYLHYLAMSGTLSGLFVSILYVRTDTAHFVYLMPLSGVIVVWLIGTIEPPRWFKAKAVPVLTAYVAIAFVLMGVACFFKTRRASQVVVTRHGQVAANGTEEVVGYIQASVAPGEHILVFPYLPLYYYLTDTFSSSELDYFQTGMHSDEQALQILEGLKKNHVRLVFLEPSFVEKIPTAWPGTPKLALLQHPIDDYIWENYHVCAELRSGADTKFLAMAENGTKCPASAA